MSTTTAQLHIRQLAKKARVFGLAESASLLPQHKRVLAEADGAKRLLSSAELRDVCEQSGTGAAALEQLQDQVEALVRAELEKSRALRLARPNSMQGWF